MRILVDSDSMPVRQRELIARAAHRTNLTATFVANRKIPLPDGEWVTMIVADDADDWLADHVGDGDLVITRDIPLAARVIEAGALVITDRGEELDRENIDARLSERDIAEDLRKAGRIEIKPSPYSERDRREFANAVDRFLTRHERGRAQNRL